jgi:hypothetical protein
MSVHLTQDELSFLAVSTRSANLPSPIWYRSPLVGQVEDERLDVYIISGRHTIVLRSSGLALMTDNLAQCR